MKLILLVVALQVAATAAPQVHAQQSADTTGIERVVVNDNRQAAGQLSNGRLEIQLDVRLGRWFPEAEDGASEVVLGFASADGAVAIPGPLVRVAVGTVVHATLRNHVDQAVTIHGFGSSANGDAEVITLPAGAQREVEFTLSKPGTFFYWGTTDSASLADRPAIASQLHGAIVVDPATIEGSSNDRVFVLGVWSVQPDSTGPKPWLPRDMMVINGKSWPHTERFDFAVGDTVRWRWVNPTPDGHPMHLHGFYFTVNSRGGPSADTVYSAEQQRLAVTELMMPGGTMSMQWVPAVAGNWLFHCHFAFHVSPYLSFAKISDPEDPAAPMAAEHDASAMRGLVLGIRVHGSEDARAVVPANPGASTQPPRDFRLLVQSAAGRYGTSPGYGYVLAGAETAIREDSVPVLSSMLLMRRGESARITVVNHLRAPTAVHWHGIEMDDSYSDGVPGWSGSVGRIATAIAPRDSFVARFTPLRSGTFIYHAHSHEAHQISSGLYGPLIVIDPDSAYDAARDLPFVIGANGPDGSKGRVNGQLQPSPIRLVAGTTYRLRIIQINPDWRIFASLASDRGAVAWRAIAKDGANLPPYQRISGATRIAMGPGETADFEFTPTEPGLVHLLVATQLPGWEVRVPLDVRTR